MLVESEADCRAVFPRPRRPQAGRAWSSCRTACASVTAPRWLVDEGFVNTRQIPLPTHLALVLADKP